MPEIVGQAVLTESQRNEINRRIENQTTDYWASGNGFFGDGAELLQGAENFLSEETAGTWAHEFDWATAPHLSGESTKEPRPGANTGAGSGNAGTRDVEEIHDAAFLSLVWMGRSEDATFNSVTKSKDLHSVDLAEAVFDVLLRRAQDANLDWSNRTNHPLDGDVDINPRFMIAAKMVKYMKSFASTYQQLSAYAPFTTNRAVVEDWFFDCADYWYQQHGIKINEVFGVGASVYPPFVDNSFADNTYNQEYINSVDFGFDPEPTTQPRTHYSSGGAGVNTITWAQASGVNNRLWDSISVVGTYGLMWNNATYISFEENMFKFFMEFGLFPDGTLNEWYRSSDIDSSTGLNYATVTGFHLVDAAYKHAVGVENGLTHLGGDRGKLFNYTTSRGTDELYNSNYSGTSTSGGTKGLLPMLLNLSNYYRSSANGGWNDVRFAEGGTAIDEENRPFTLMYAMANGFYKRQELEDLYKGDSGFTSPNYYSNGFTIDSAGSWGEHSLQPWGGPSAYGRYLGVAEMEDFLFASGQFNESIVYYINP
jgi:hypothetical protein